MGSKLLHNEKHKDWKQPGSPRHEFDKDTIITSGLGKKNYNSHRFLMAKSGVNRLRRGGETIKKLAKQQIIKTGLELVDCSPYSSDLASELQHLSGGRD